MRTLAGVGVLIMFALSAEIGAQKCVLQVGAWESYPAEKTSNGGTVWRRKGTVTGFTATAVNQRTKRVYKSVSLMGSIYFEDMPEDLYKITIRKPGFKTTVQTQEFSRRYARDDIEFVDIQVSRGPSSQVVARQQPNTIPPRDPNKYTVRGDVNYGSGNVLEPLSARKTISGGILNGKANSLPKPPYPPAARAVRASGAVSVQVLIDEGGNVISASAVSGHPLLQPAAVAAARAAKFSPTLLEGNPVKVSGVITYNFVP